jgi:SAM-dependent methyltransferase
VDYDDVASAYDRRYETNRFEGIASALGRFIAEAGSVDVAEVGCGTGHWLAGLAGRVRSAAGLDLSSEMLRRARAAAPRALLARGRATELPWGTARFDRLFCINALHHFGDAAAFLGDARRVLRSTGALLIIGLDPHTGLDRWWIYDYFPGALDADRARHPSTAVVRAQMRAAGFEETITGLAQHLPAAVPFAAAEERGIFDRRTTSQLMIMSDAEYAEGLQRLRAERPPMLHADLRLYATIGYMRAGTPGSRDVSEPARDEGNGAQRI